MSKRADPRYLALEATLREQLNLYLESKNYRDIKNTKVKSKDLQEIFKKMIGIIQKYSNSNNLVFNQNKLNELEFYNLFNLFDEIFKTLKDKTEIDSEFLQNLMNYFIEKKVIIFN